MWKTDFSGNRMTKNSKFYISQYYMEENNHKKSRGNTSPKKSNKSLKSSIISNNYN